MHNIVREASPVPLPITNPVRLELGLAEDQARSASCSWATICFCSLLLVFVHCSRAPAVSDWRLDEMGYGLEALTYNIKDGYLGERFWRGLVSPLLAVALDFPHLRSRCWMIYSPV